MKKHGRKLKRSIKKCRDITISFFAKTVYNSIMTEVKDYFKNFKSSDIFLKTIEDLKKNKQIEINNLPDIAKNIYIPAISSLMREKIFNSFC